MQKQKNPLPKRQRTIRIASIDRAAERAAQAKWENDHHKAIAGYYFDDTPTLPNLARGTYHWLMGNVFRENEDPNVTELTVSGWIGSPTSKGMSIVRNAKKLGQLLRRGVNKETVRVVTEKAKQAGRSFKEGLKSAIVGDLDDYEAETRAIRNGINQADDVAPIIAEEAGQAAQAASSTANSINSAVNQGTRAAGQAQRFKKKAAAANKAREATEKELRQARNAVQEANQRATTSESRAAELQRKVEELKQAAAERATQADRAAQTGQAAEEAVQTGQTVTQAGQTAGQTAANSDRGFWGNLQRVLWETKDNNFGKYYIGKNILRAAGYPFIIPPLLGAGYEHIPEAFRSYGDYAKKSFNYGRGKPAVQDSTRVNSTGRDSSQILQPTDSQQIQQPQSVLPQARNGVIQAEDMQAVIDSLLEL